MLGPVFRFELITTARRKRYFVARFVYGLFLLVSLWNQYAASERSAGYPRGNWLNAVTPLEESLARLSRFAQEMFSALAWAQGIALLCLVPALLAGVIADEYQRKTLHYLLASPMSSAEIILGKLGARLLHVGVIVLMGVPVVCLLALFGGLDPWEVTYVYAGTFALVLFVSGLSLVVSVSARRPREAILVAYVLLFVWLFVPPALAPVAKYYGWPLTWVAPVNDFLLLTNPIHVWRLMTDHRYMLWMQGNGMVTGWLAQQANENLARFLWMAGFQTAFGVLFLLLAIVGLRPLRGHEPGPARTRVRNKTLAQVASALRTVPKRPPCDDDDPMIWKERFATGGGFTWLRSRLVVLFLTVLLGSFLFDAGLPACGQLFGQSWGVGGGLNPRLMLNGALRGTSAFLFVLLLLSVASAAAVSLTSEREQDTWTSLTATLLTGREIVLAKIRGAVWCSHRLVLALLIVWTVGTLLGAIFPLGALMAVYGMFIFCWFTAALGVWISLRAKNSTRALFATIFWMLVFNAGYLILISRFVPDSDLPLAGMMPYMEWASLLSYDDASRLFSGGRMQVEGSISTHGVSLIVAYLIGVFGYGVGALLLTGAAVDTFEKAVDRPKREHRLSPSSP